jgi:hypothetical protein
MALDYAASAALMSDTAFKERVKVSGLKYASYIMDEGPTIDAHWSRIKWAQDMFFSPDVTVNKIIPLVVLDPQVQTDGADITDDALQPVVESVINKMM